MFHKYLRAITLICLLLGTTAFAAGEQDSLQAAKERLRVPPLPDDYRGVTIDGVEYIKGIIFLDSVKDTAILTEHGFIVQTVRKESADRVVCQARWLKDMDPDSFPDQIREIQYISKHKKAEPQRQDFPERPEDYPSVTIDGIQYTKALMYFKTDEDTALVSPFGVRIKRFWSRMSRTGAGYIAMWPIDIALDSLPPQVIDVEYPDPSKLKRHFAKMPENQPSTVIEGVEYVSGIIFLHGTEKDTSILQQFGIRINRVDIQDSRSISFRVRIPKDLDVDSLPERIFRIKWAPVLELDLYKSADSIKPETGRKTMEEKLRFPPLPDNYRGVTINGVEYVVGLIFLSTEEDTAILKEHRFTIQLVKRLDSATVICRARWPKDMELDSLPDQVLKIRYSPVPKKKRRPGIHPPPKDYSTLTLPDGSVYVDGKVHLESDQDTMLLKKFGFRGFIFWKRDSTKVVYMAIWPKELPWDSLPPQLKMMGYWRDVLETQLNVSADSIKTETPKHNSPDRTQ